MTSRHLTFLAMVTIILNVSKTAEVVIPHNLNFFFKKEGRYLYSKKSEITQL
jgi:hypothetical protein